MFIFLGNTSTFADVGIFFGVVAMDEGSFMERDKIKIFMFHKVKVLRISKHEDVTRPMLRPKICVDLPKSCFN